MEFDHEDDLLDFLLVFVKDTTAKFKVNDEVVVGTAFYFVRNTRTGIVEAHINEQVREYIFTRKDIELMTKNKHKIKMTSQEMDEYKQNESKYKQLMIYSQTDLVGISGRYSKRLYMLLIQFRKSKVLIMTYNKFKEVLEIPESYQACNIDIRVLKPAKEELIKAGITITEIKKIKSGKEIKTIEIYFDYTERVTKSRPTYKKQEEPKEEHKEYMDDDREDLKKAQEIYASMTSEQKLPYITKYNELPKGIKKIMSVEAYTVDQIKFRV